jgi:hypothetical protein
VALSIALIVVMELFLNRSVKILHLAALKDRDNEHSIKAARWRILTDQVFTPLKCKICSKNMIMQDLTPTPQMLLSKSQTEHEIRLLFPEILPMIDATVIMSLCRKKTFSY